MQVFLQHKETKRTVSFMRLFVECYLVNSSVQNTVY